MAVTLNITDGYATVQEADVYLELDATWQAADDDVKADALMWGRYYIDSDFDYDLTVIDVIDEEAKLANSILAADYVRDGKIFGDSEAAIVSKTVKADVVSKSVTYDVSKEYKPPSYGKVVVLMGKIATKKSPNTVFLLRG